MLVAHVEWWPLCKYYQSICLFAPHPPTAQHWNTKYMNMWGSLIWVGTRNTLHSFTNQILTHSFILHTYISYSGKWPQVQVTLAWTTNTGCPILLGPLCFFVISRVLEHLQRNFLPFFNSPGNLLHYSHKNFENWFRNSWDNLGQSCHL